MRSRLFIMCVGYVIVCIGQNKTREFSFRQFWQQQSKQIEYPQTQTLAQTPKHKTQEKPKPTKGYMQKKR